LLRQSLITSFTHIVKMFSVSAVLLRGGYGNIGRHPNYFAECLIWWSWGIFAIPTGNIMAIVSPVFITYLMVKVKAAQEVEEEIAKRRPDYKKYIENTSFMVPWRSKL